MARLTARDWFADWAARYDDALGAMGMPETIEPAVDLLAALAGDGRALEFAIGTGRIALPLAARGVDVSGIDLSEPMVEQLRAKPGGSDIAVTIGDIATTRVDGAFRLVYLVFNTINNLTSQDRQVACFQNAARMTLRERCQDWDRSPFTSESRRHVSVWTKT